MFGNLGPVGAFGVAVLLVGIGVIASENLIVAGGLALVLAGLGFVVYGLVRSLLSSMGMGGMV